MEDKYILIEDYLDGVLSEDERTQFESSLKKDKELAAEVALYKETRESLGTLFKEEEADQALQSTLNELNQAHFKQASAKTGRVIPLFLRLAAAAVAIFTLGYFAYLFSRPGTPSYADYADHVAADFTVMSSEGPNVADAQSAFNQGNYQQAEAALNTLIETNPTRSDLRLYLGISQLENGNHQQAASNFNQLLENPDYRNEANWYLALNQLAQEQLAEAKPFLEQVEAGSSRYAKAQELLKKLP